MGRPDYEDSIAGGNDDGSEGDSSTGFLYFGGQSLGSLTGSGSISLNTSLGSLQEDDNGTP